MEWIYESDALSGDSRYVSNTDRGWYDVVYAQYNTYGYYIAYIPPNRIGGHLSSRLRIECGFGRVSAGTLPDNCKFKTVDEAKAVCERHYDLLILQ